MDLHKKHLLNRDYIGDFSQSAVDTSAHSGLDCSLDNFELDSDLGHHNLRTERGLPQLDQQPVYMVFLTTWLCFIFPCISICSIFRVNLLYFELNCITFEKLYCTRNFYILSGFLNYLTSPHYIYIFNKPTLTLDYQIKN